MELIKTPIEDVFNFENDFDFFVVNDTRENTHAPDPVVQTKNERIFIDAVDFQDNKEDSFLPQMYGVDDLPENFPAMAANYMFNCLSTDHTNFVSFSQAKEGS